MGIQLPGDAQVLGKQLFDHVGKKYFELYDLYLL